MRTCRAPSGSGFDRSVALMDCFPKRYQENGADEVTGELEDDDDGVGAGGSDDVRSSRTWGSAARGTEPALRIQSGSGGDRCEKAATKLGVGEHGKGNAAEELRGACGMVGGGARDGEGDLGQWKAGIGCVDSGRV